MVSTSGSSGIVRARRGAEGRRKLRYLAYESRPTSIADMARHERFLAWQRAHELALAVYRGERVLAIARNDMA